MDVLNLGLEGMKYQDSVNIPFILLLQLCFGKNLHIYLICTNYFLVITGSCTTLNMLSIDQFVLSEGMKKNSFIYFLN